MFRKVTKRFELGQVLLLDAKCDKLSALLSQGLYSTELFQMKDDEIRGIRSSYYE